MICPTHRPTSNIDSATYQSGSSHRRKDFRYGDHHISSLFYILSCRFYYLHLAFQVRRTSLIRIRILLMLLQSVDTHEYLRHHSRFYKWQHYCWLEARGRQVSIINGILVRQIITDLSNEPLLLLDTSANKQNPPMHIYIYI